MRQGHLCNCLAGESLKNACVKEVALQINEDIMKSKRHVICSNIEKKSSCKHEEMQMKGKCSSPNNGSCPNKETNFQEQRKMSMRKYLKQSSQSPSKSRSGKATIQEWWQTSLAIQPVKTTKSRLINHFT